MRSLFFSATSVAAVVIGLAGLVTLFIGLRRLLAAAATSRWPSVPGTVLTAQVVEEVSRRASEDDGDGDAPQRVIHTFRAAVTYRYTVDGKVLEGSKIATDAIDSSDPEGAQDLVRGLPPQTAVDVFYDPAQPAKSVLRPGISRASAIVPAVGVGLVLLAAALLAIVWKVSGR